MENSLRQKRRANRIAQAKANPGNPFKITDPDSRGVRRAKNRLNARISARERFVAKLSNDEVKAFMIPGSLKCK